MPAAQRSELKESIDRIEEAYEFMLAYAAQGVSGEAVSGPSSQLRDYLQRADDILTDLAARFTELVKEEGLESADRYAAFLALLERDASDAKAAVQLVLAQPSISSQLIDNLNASMHVRTLLTDLFLIDEILNPHVPQPSRT